MRKSRFSTRQIASILEEGASGKKIAEVCLKHGISIPTFYLWKSKHRANSNPASTEAISNQQGVSVSAPSDADHVKLRQRVTYLEQENDLLRKLFIESSLEKATMKAQEKTKVVPGIA